MNERERLLEMLFKMSYYLKNQSLSPDEEEAEAKVVFTVLHFLRTIGVRKICSYELGIMRNHKIVNCISDLYRLDPVVLGELFGPEKGKAIFLELMNKDISFSTFLVALGIPYFGKRKAKKIVSLVGSMEELLEKDLVWWVHKPEGIGIKTSEEAYNKISGMKDEILNVLQFIDLIPG